MFNGFLKNANYDDIDVWLKEGEQTKFIFNEQKLTSVKEQLGELKKDNDLFKIVEYLHVSCKFDKNNQVEKFTKTAREIWKRKICTGCTDYALVFATIARQLGVPTILVSTVDLDWIEDYKNDAPNAEYLRGHEVCECYIDDKWVYVDPIQKYINGVYNKNNLIIAKRKVFAKSTDLFEVGIKSLEDLKNVWHDILKTNNE